MPCRAPTPGSVSSPARTAADRLRRLDAPGGAAVDAGLLSSSWATADGRRRRVYALTAPGAAALATEQTEYRHFTRGIQAVLGWSA